MTIHAPPPPNFDPKYDANMSKMMNHMVTMFSDGFFFAFYLFLFFTETT